MFGFWAKTVQPFHGKLFKGLLKLHCTCQLDYFGEKRFFVRKIVVINFGNFGKSFRELGKNLSASLSKRPSTCPQETYEKKFFWKKGIHFDFFVFWASIFDIIMFLLGHGRQEKVIFICPTDQFKRNGKLIFVSRRSTFSYDFWRFDQNFGGGLSRFKRMRPVEPWVK